MHTQTDQNPHHSLRAATMTVIDPVFDHRTGELVLSFGFDDQPPVRETLVFEGGPFEPDDSRDQVIRKLTQMLAVFAGTSYFKARLPDQVHLPGVWSARALALVSEVYSEGLAEFALRNGIARIEPQFVCQHGDDPERIQLALERRSIVAIGGGKDSAVAIEMLRSAGEQMVGASVGTHHATRLCAEAAGLNLIEVQRRLAEELTAWNTAGAPNGHVPVTAIHSVVLCMLAVLHGFDRVVMANERSADEPTRTDESGRAVNHQYSKSYPFERALRDWISSEVCGGFEYFSLLRPLSELEICRRFAGMEQYHGVFVSCNAAYRRDPERRSSRWCGECPKCRFVFLGLAPFMRHDDLAEIFGADLLGDEAQINGFLDLLSRETKPFECVGTRVEVRAAFGLLRADHRWRETPVVRAVCESCGITPYRIEHARSLLSPSGEHSVPPELAAKLGF